MSWTGPLAWSLLPPAAAVLLVVLFQPNDTAAVGLLIFAASVGSFLIAAGLTAVVIRRERETGTLAKRRSWYNALLTITFAALLAWAVAMMIGMCAGVLCLN